MRLVSLEIDGFKSFAEKTVINFQTGVTGIIGPNGSGKSNIIEAIRWVMGEQSAKTLRGDKMVDVIFNGATDRAPLNRALVKLTLDNSDHYLNTPYTEVTVCRKLFRSGDSEYLLNGQSVRLKDIVNLFIDSGIGKESFAVISQGRVAEIFNGKPQDRRKMIEAVAGVGKYKADKETAQRRLAETNDNLNRVNDIIYELQQRLGPLEEQRALAQDYVAQKQRLDRLDQTATVRAVEAANERLTTILTRKQQAEKLAADYEARVHAANAQAGQLQSQRQKLLHTKDQQQATILRLTQEIGQLNNDQSVAQVRQEQLTAEVARLTEQQAETTTKLAAAQRAVEAAQQTQGQHETRVQAAKEQLAALQAAQAPDQQAKLTAEIEALRAQQVEQLQSLTTLHNQQTFIKQSQSRGQSQADQVAADLAQRQEQLQARQAALATSQAAVEATGAQVTAKQGQLQDLQAQLTTTQGQYETAQKQWYQALGTLQSQQARLKNYQAMAADYTGYFYGVQNVLRQRQTFPGLFGAVGELLTVPKEYTLALETVLGGQLQHLVVDSQASGKQIINYLTRTRGGRVTILPLDSLRGGRVPAAYAAVANHPGLLGKAVDLVQFEARYQPVVDQLLATTVVADNLDHATEIARLGRHQLRVVTLNGELINASGAMTGGKTKQQRVGLLTQKKRQQEFEAAVQQATTASQQAEQAVQTWQQKRQDLQAAGQTATEELTTLQARLSEQRDHLQQVTSEVQDLQRQIAALQLQTSQQDSQHSQYEDQVQAAQAAAEQLETELDQTKAELAAKQAALTQLTSQSADQAEARHQAQQALAVENERLHQAQAAVAERQAELARLQSTVQALNEQLAAAKERLTATPTASAAQIQSLQAELTAAQAQVTELNDQLEQLEQTLGDATTESDRLQGLMRVAYDDLTRINEQRLACEQTIDQGENHLSEQYHTTLAAAKAQVVDLPDEELQRQIKLLHRGIEELGEVNVAAIGEYETVKERYDFLAAQQTDLLEAEDQLKQTMAKMDQEVKRRFSQTFQQLSTAFATTFKQVFAGGQAKLILTEPHDLLETGVDIYAQPPGKKNQQLSLLSGGEKALTALALLFAVLKVHPVPFAILDEPEAALDDVNVDRFATYLDRFGNQGPQFIVITHRKGTMVNADVLYGVTMQDSGVSKVITVNVDQTLKAAQTK